MGELVGHILEVIGRILLELANWISQSRLAAISPAWAWPIAICLAIGFIAFLAHLWLGHPWLYQLAFGAFGVAGGLACVTALCSRSRG